MVTRVLVEAGICGFTTTIKATKTGKRRVSVDVESDCEDVAEMDGQLQDMGWLEALGQPGESVVWECACACIKHPSCPVPMAILKAIEVELDLALPKDVVIHFVDSERQ
jgi:hypothetical protein